jgi:hypothetical protein
MRTSVSTSHRLLSILMVYVVDKQINIYAGRLVSAPQTSAQKTGGTGLTFTRSGKLMDPTAVRQIEVSHRFCGRKTSQSLILSETMAYDQNGAG